MERFRNLSAMSLWINDEKGDVDSMFSGITRLEVIEYSADAFTQSLDAHMISKYEGDLKTKNHDRTPTAALYGES